jgi:hypothetical protein
MPTNVAYKSESISRRTPKLVEAVRSEDMTVLLFFAMTGLAISLGLAALGLFPDMRTDLMIFG